MEHLKPFKPTVREIVAYLEDKISSGLETDDEYEVYCQYKDYGWQYILDKYNKLLRELVEEMKDEWGGDI